MIKNVILTSIYTYNECAELMYFGHQIHESVTRYCTGIIPAEVAAKQTLSAHKIDEILVLGPGSAADKKDYFRERVLRECDPLMTLEKGSTTYDYFCYRLQQFLKDMDLEQDKRIEAIEPEKRKYLERVLEKSYQRLSENGKLFTEDRYFDVIQNPGFLGRKEVLRDALKKRDMEGTLSNEDYVNLGALAYEQMTIRNKVFPSQQNLSVSLRYIPTGNDLDDSMENIISVFKAISEGEDVDKVRLYVDLYSSELMDSYTVFTVLNIMTSLLGKEFEIADIYGLNFSSNEKPAGILYDWKERYQISRLFTAVSVFLEYGKADPLDRYWNEIGEEDLQISSMIYGMKRIDNALSLCDIVELEKGIEQLKQVINMEDRDHLSDNLKFNGKVFHIIKEGLARDYGNLLVTEKPDLLDLLKWCQRKKLYQQALTIIESRAPEDFLKRGIIYYARGEEDIERVLQTLCKEYYEKASYQRWMFNELPHYMLKTYGRGFMRRTVGSIEKASNYAKFVKERILYGEALSRGEEYSFNRVSMDSNALKNLEDILPGYSLIAENPDLLENLLIAYYYIGEIRNKINHADCKQVIDFSGLKEMGESPKKREVCELIAFFISRYEEARKLIEGKELLLMEVDNDTFQNYVNSHKPESKENKKDSSGKHTK